MNSFRKAQSETDRKFSSNIFGQKYIDTKKVEEITVRARNKGETFCIEVD